MQQRALVEKEDQIVMPKVSIKYVPKVLCEGDAVFQGKTITLPEVIVDYLSTAELRVFKHIFRHIRMHGHCITRLSSLAFEVDTTPQAVQMVLKNLRRMGFVYSEKTGRRVEYFIDFTVITKLDKYTEGLKPGAVTFMRRRFGTISISTLVGNEEHRKDVLAKYEDRPFDPIEDEEYN